MGLEMLISKTGHDVGIPKHGNCNSVAVSTTPAAVTLLSTTELILITPTVGVTVTGDGIRGSLYVPAGASIPIDVKAASISIVAAENGTASVIEYGG